MSKCITVITPGQCGSSLLLHLLYEMGVHSPPNQPERTQNRHPWGNHEDPELTFPQIRGDKEHFLEVVQRYNDHSEIWALKLINGFLIWPDILDEIKPYKLIYFFREDHKKVRARAGDWADVWQKNIQGLLKDLTYFRLSFEQLVANPLLHIEQLYSYVIGGEPPDLSHLADLVEYPPSRRLWNSTSKATPSSDSSSSA